MGGRPTAVVSAWPAARPAPRSTVRGRAGRAGHASALGRERRHLRERAPAGAGGVYQRLCTEHGLAGDAGSVTISSNPGLEFRRAGSFFDEGCNCWLVGFGNCWLVGGWGCWLVRIRSCWLVSLGGESRDSSDTMRIAPCRRVFQEFNPKGEPG